MTESSTQTLPVPPANTRTARATRGTMASFIQVAAQIGLQVLLAPLILKHGGRETLGAFSILMQAVGYFALADNAFNVAFGRYLAQAWSSDGNHQAFSQVLKAGQRFYMVSSVAFSLLAILLSFRVETIFSLSPGLATQVRVALYILVFGAIVKAPIAAYTSALSATQNLASANFIALLGNVARAFLSLGLVASDLGLVGLALGNVIADLLSAVAHRYWFARVSGESSWGCARLKLSVLFEMVRFGAIYSFVVIASKLFLSTDSIIVGALHGPVAAGRYYTSQIPAFFLMTLVWRLTSNAAPAINELCGLNAGDRLRLAYIELLRCNLSIGGGLALSVIAFNRLVVSLWVGREQYLGDTMTLSAGLFLLIQVFAYANEVFLLAFGRVRIMAVVSISAGIANVALSVGLGRALGPEGVMVASVVALLPSALLLWCQVLKDLELSRMRVFRQAVLPAVGVNILILLPAGLAFRWASWLTVQQAVIACAIALPAWCFLFLRFGLSDRLRYHASSLFRISPPLHSGSAL